MTRAEQFARGTKGGAGGVRARVPRCCHWCPVVVVVVVVVVVGVLARGTKGGAGGVGARVPRCCHWCRVVVVVVVVVIAVLACGTKGGARERERISKLVFYAQSTGAVISGRERESCRRRRSFLLLLLCPCTWHK